MKLLDISPIVNLKYFCLLRKGKEQELQTYIFNCYSFSKIDIPKNLTNAWNALINWRQSLKIKPVAKADITVEHKRWVLSHLDDAEELWSFHNKYKKTIESYNTLKNEYRVEINEICAEKLANPEHPTYPVLELLCNKSVLLQKRTEINYRNAVIENPIRSSYIEQYKKICSTPSPSKEYILQHLAVLDEYIEKQELQKRINELKRLYPDGFAAYSTKKPNGRYFASWSEESRSLLDHSSVIKDWDYIIKKLKATEQSLGVAFADAYDDYWSGKGIELYDREDLVDVHLITAFIQYNEYKQLSNNSFPSKCKELSSSTRFKTVGYPVRFKKDFAFFNETVQVNYELCQSYRRPCCNERAFYNNREIKRWSRGYSTDKISRWFYSLKQNVVTLNNVIKKEAYFKDFFYDSLFDYINQLNNLVGINYVIFGDSKLDNPTDFNNFHFSYLEKRLSNNNIPSEQLSFLQNTIDSIGDAYNGKSINIAFVEMVTYRDCLRTNTQRIINAFPDSFVNVLYISIFKHYNQEELTELLEKVHVIEKAQSLARFNQKGFQLYFPDIDPDKLGIDDYDKAQLIISKKDDIEYITDQPNRLRAKVKDWNGQIYIPSLRHGSVSHYFFYWYYPTRYTDVTEESLKARRLVYRFKDGVNHTKVLDMVSQKLKMTFTEEELKEMVFVCVPASNAAANQNRYQSFMEDLHNNTKIINGFSKIQVTQNRAAAHLASHHTVFKNYTIDRDFFREKNIIVFDDIVTKGDSMRLLIEELSLAGGNVIGAMSIGRTYGGTDNRMIHPWTNAV